ncbi:MAG: hypothetical protein RIT28_2752, partial [Pseudomonadota bacterium]
MSRVIALTDALNALLDESKADPNPDEATKAARQARAATLMDELTAELQAQTAALNAEAERMRADTARMNREAELYRWKTAQMEDLVARAGSVVEAVGVVHHRDREQLGLGLLLGQLAALGPGRTVLQPVAGRAGRRYRGLC